MKSPFAKKPNIILVDDHKIFRQGLKSLITNEDLGKVVGEASDGKEFINLLSLPAPDLVLMDVDMPEMNGMEASQEALKIYPNLKIIAFTMYDDEEYFRKMVEIGVKGYIIKSTGINEVEQAISDVMNGKTYFSKVSQKGNSKKADNKTPGDQNESNSKSSAGSWWW